jgi:hypothetical protein
MPEYGSKWIAVKFRIGVPHSKEFFLSCGNLGENNYKKLISLLPVRMLVFYVNPERYMLSNELKSKFDMTGAILQQGSSGNAIMLRLIVQIINGSPSMESLLNIPAELTCL